MISQPLWSPSMFFHEHSSSGLQEVPFSSAFAFVESAHCAYSFMSKSGREKASSNSNCSKDVKITGDQNGIILIHLVQVQHGKVGYLNKNIKIYVNHIVHHHKTDFMVHLVTLGPTLGLALRGPWTWWTSAFDYRQGLAKSVLDMSKIMKNGLDDTGKCGFVTIHIDLWCLTTISNQLTRDMMWHMRMKVVCQAAEATWPCLLAYTCNISDISP